MWSSSTNSQLVPRSLSLQAYKEKLIALLKKEVKHIMEESVMLKSIHEDSATVTSLCAVVDTCLSLGKLPTNFQMIIKTKEQDGIHGIME